MDFVVGANYFNLQLDYSAKTARYTGGPLLFQSSVDNADCFDQVSSAYRLVLIITRSSHNNCRSRALPPSNSVLVTVTTLYLVIGGLSQSGTVDHSGPPVTRSRPESCSFLSASSVGSYQHKDRAYCSTVYGGQSPASSRSL